MAELAYACDSKSHFLTEVWVQLPPFLHKEIENKEKVHEGEVKLDSYEARQQVHLPEALLERKVELRKEIAAAIEKAVEALQPDEATTASTNKTHQAETRASDKNCPYYLLF